MISCIGDLHIDALERLIPNSTSKILATLDSVIDNEVKRGASAIVLLGDIFDSADPEQDTILSFADSMRRHPDVPKYIIMGNHDYADVKNHSLKLIRWMCKIGFINGKVFIKPKKMKIDDEYYLFSPHPYIVNNPPKVSYCFGHFGFSGAKSDTGYTLKSNNKPKGRWILGDYHTAQRGKTYMYAGSLTQVKFFEAPEKYIIRIENTPQLVQIKPKIVLGRTNITSEEDLANLDPEVYWSVNIKRKAKISPDWASKYPHVIRLHTEKSTNKRQKILMKKVASDDPLEGLPDYLRNEGLNDKEIKIAMRFVGR
jgi:DNA repair exonuclease SbcCD nuclease subunit